MRDNKDEPPDDDGSARESGRRNRMDAGFDRWLTDRLHAVYDPVLREQVPEELERLLERFARRQPPDPNSK